MANDYSGRHKRWTVMQIILLAVLVCGLAGCRDNSESTEISAESVPTRTLVSPTATPVPPEAPTTPTPTDLPGPDALRPTDTVDGAEPLPYDVIVATALDDLVETRNVTPDDIRLISLDAVIWEDELWGCASDAGSGSEASSSAELSGYRVVFGADSRVFVYHTDEFGNLRLCDDRQWLTVIGEPVLTEPIAEAMVDLSRRDAARQLDVAEADLRLGNVLTLSWPDSSMGCPRPGADYDDRETQGYRIVFLLDQEPVIYHTSIRDVMRCAPEEEILPGVLRRALPDVDEE